MITTHVLDTAAGRPAAGIAVRLEVHGDTGWRTIRATVTDDDGRVRDFGEPAVAGRYRLTFDTAARSAFFPEITVTFVVTDPGEHHHVPILLSPFAFSTYRGS
ncbi:MAG TPA: hydroxyisourate hydrolase [Pseudonocardiaceae bacterium]|jgi:5-hydroxyisourate hydrolase|nr:hydroxyisourate hydrolase [Pseudonocardiaceae bacterium]